MKPQKQFEVLLDEAKAVAASRAIKTEADRLLSSLLVRLLEIQVKGAPETSMPQRHHA